MTRRIVVTGSECTGKTTLARGLAEHLGCDWTPEFSRAYAEQVQRPLAASDVEAIARGQCAVEDAALVGAPAMLVLDTDLVSTLVYANVYYGAAPAWIAAEVRRRTGDFYLLCDIDLPWAPDGVRDAPTRRTEIHRTFTDTLAQLGARVHLVRGLGPARLDAALAGISLLEAEFR